MYALGHIAAFGATTEKKRVDVVGLYPEESKYLGTVWHEFYIGGVYSTRPSERTVRFVNDYFATNYPHVPATAEAHFKPDGTMDYIEVFAPFTTGPRPAPVSLPFEKVAIPVELRLGSDVVRTTTFRTSYLSEKSIKFLNAWIASRYHWSDKYKYQLWKPKSVVVRMDVPSGRPDKITVNVVKGSVPEAQTAKATYLAMM
jgi:hypothetical protein